MESTEKQYLDKEMPPNGLRLYNKLRLLAFFAWAGLGIGGLSSSIYGPQESVMLLGVHNHLGLIIAILSIITIFIISAGYTQLIELYPNGAGAYHVASKLLSPIAGVVSGSALLIGYVLTIAVSAAAGTEALFSILTPGVAEYKTALLCLVIIFIIFLNMNVPKQRLLPIIAVFVVFLASHLFIIAYSLITHALYIGEVVDVVSGDFRSTATNLGFFGIVSLIVYAYGIGAGTYTGLGFVSDTLPVNNGRIAKWGKPPLIFLSVSLSVLVSGLILSFVLIKINPSQGKTINAVLFSKITSDWGESASYIASVITLLSEAALLFVAVQTGFVAGPRILTNLAIDRWVPVRFASPSNRLVNQYGILIMGAAALLISIAGKGNLRLLIIICIMGIFVSFGISQLALAKHWWLARDVSSKWKMKFTINILSIIISIVILLTVTIAKLNDGGWIGILMIIAVAVALIIIKNEYNKAGTKIKQLDYQLSDEVFQYSNLETENPGKPVFDTKSKTAIILVNGYTGLGIHSFFSVFKLFGTSIKNYVFVQVGIANKGNSMIDMDNESIREQTAESLQSYIGLANRHGYWAEGIALAGLEVEEEIIKALPDIKNQYKNIIFFGGQIVFPKDSFLNRLLHNYTVLSLQRKLYNQGIQLITLPIKIDYR